MRVATWNTKQAVAPVLPPDRAWAWMEEHIDPDIVVLTEAKVPRDGVPAGWSAEWVEGGIGPRRRWGTVVAARGVRLERIHEVRSRFRTRTLDPTWPAAAIVADAFVGSERWATIVGLYAVTVDATGVAVGNGAYSLPKLLEDLEPVFASRRSDRVILAGDFNLWPRDVSRILDRYPVIDLIAETAVERKALPGCCGCDLDRCGHLWTHRNRGGKNPSVQQLDYLLAGPGLIGDLVGISGGYGDFPHADEASDHAPVVAEFRS